MHSIITKQAEIELFLQKKNQEVKCEQREFRAATMIVTLSFQGQGFVTSDDFSRSDHDLNVLLFLEEKNPTVA